MNPFSVKSSQKKAVPSKGPPPARRKAPVPYQGGERKSMPPKQALQTNGTRKRNAVERNGPSKRVDIEEFGGEEVDVTPDDDVVDTVDDVDMTGG